MYRSMLLRYLAPQRRDVTALAVLLVAGIALPLIAPQIVRTFIDRAAEGRPVSELTRIALIYVVLAVVLQVAVVLRAWFGERVGWTATNEMRADLVEHALYLDLPFHNSSSPGEMIERVDGDVNALSIFFSQLVVNVLGAGLLLVGVLVVVAFENLTVGLVLAGYTMLMALVLTRLRAIAIPHSDAERQASANLFGFLEERLVGSDDLRALDAGDHVMRGFAKVTGAGYRTSMRAERVAVWIWMSTFSMVGLGNVLSLAMGGWLYRQGSITLGTVYLLFQYMQMVSQPLEQIADQLQQLQEAGAGITRVGRLMAERSAIADDGTVALPDGPLDVAVDGVCFHYDPTEPVLAGLSFTIAPGRVLGIVGRTGSGKTTISRLLSRLYDPGAGTIRFGGVDIRDTPLAEVRRHVGIVTQDVQLFHATVRDNLSLFDPDISDARMHEVVSHLGLDEWLDRLPDGLDSVLAGGGLALSAGEAQLLAFARVFLLDPGLVVLDEASSRLDPVTERLIERAVSALLDGRTAILIAHRLRTLDRADEVLVLDHGRAVEHGSRQALAGDPSSRFAGLLATGASLA